MKNLIKLVLLFLIIGCIKSNGQNNSGLITKRNLSFVSDGVLLKGTLYLPSGENLPVIVHTHGSGKDGRHGRAYQYMGEFFPSLGFATFIFDKRGVGASEGKYVESTDFNIPAHDLIKAVEIVKAQPEIDANKIGVMGISQGGWVGPLAATLSKDISFVISFVGGGVSVRDQVLHHRKSELIKKGWPKVKIDSAVTFCKRLYDYCATGIGYEQLKDDYLKASKENWFSFIKDQGFGSKLVSPEYLTHPWFQSLKHDPREVEEKIGVPFLAVFGELDQHVPTKDAVKAMRRAFEKSSFKDYKIVIAPNEGHNTFKMQNGIVEFRKAFKKPLVHWLKDLQKRL